VTTTAAGSLLPIPVALPLAGAVCAPLLARLSARLPLLVCALALLGSLAVLILVAPTVYGHEVVAHYLGGWTPVRGAVLGIAFAADPFGLTFALVAAGVGTLLVVYTLSELGGLGARELGGYACLFQLLIAALIGAALTADLFNLFVWFEVAALAGYGLTGFFLERPIALEAAFKILVLTTMAGFGVFIGAGLLYSGHGALNFAQLHGALAVHASTADLVALGLLVAGFATKAGLVPFHGWLADAHTAAPGPVSALFSGLMVNLGVVAVGRLAFQVFPTDRVPILGALMVIGVVSALVGALLALAQDDLKRLLAYDTVSQMGVLAIGLATGAPAGVAGSVYHLVNHALFKSLLFLCAGAIVHRTGVTSLAEMGGLLRRWPAVAAAFTVGAGVDRGDTAARWVRLAQLDPSRTARRPPVRAIRADAARATHHHHRARARGVAGLLPAAYARVRAQRAAASRNADRAGRPERLLRRVRRRAGVRAGSDHGSRRGRIAACDRVQPCGARRVRVAARHADRVSVLRYPGVDGRRSESADRRPAHARVPAAAKRTGAGPPAARRAHRISERPTPPTPVAGMIALIAALYWA